MALAVPNAMPAACANATFGPTPIALLIVSENEMSRTVTPVSRAHRAAGLIVPDTALVGPPSGSGDLRVLLLA